jgi:hypothetical protein
MKIKQELPFQEPLKGKYWVDQYNTLIKDVNKRKVEIQSSLSQYDSEQDDILHHLEMIRCDAIVSSKLIKALISFRAKRRIIKDELAALNSISTLAKQSKYSNNERCVYKTNIISIVLGGETIE